MLCGCASDHSSKSGWTGPAAPVPVASERWEYEQQPGQVLRTAHYLIHTTISEPEVLRRLPQVMEGAYAQYQAFVIGPAQTQPMRCYVFSRRGEWAHFTSGH